MTTTTNYSTIAQLNNHAVALFQRGHHDDAVKSLNVAINQLVWCVGDEPETGRVSSTAGAAATSPPPSSSYSSFCPSENATPIRNGCGEAPSCHRRCCDARRQPTYTPHSGCSGFLFPVSIRTTASAAAAFAASASAVPTSTPRCESQNESTSSLSSVMYSRVMVLAETSCHCCCCCCRVDDESSSALSERYIIRASVAVLYNLAFVHHWRGIQIGIPSSLTKALQMYSKILRTIHLKENLPDVEIVLVAIWNNVGHLLCQLCQLDEARVCFDRLRFLLLANSVNLRCWLPAQDFEFLLLNAVFQASTLHLAPAA